MRRREAGDERDAQGKRRDETEKITDRLGMWEIMDGYKAGRVYRRHRASTSLALFMRFVSVAGFG